MDISTNPWVLTILGGLIVGVVVLVIEYGFFQKDKPIVVRRTSPKPDWPKAIEKMLPEFKRRVGKYRWRNEHINVVTEKIEKGKAYLCMEIWLEKENVLHSSRELIDRYKLLIDRTGDILKMECVSVSSTERQQSKVSLSQFDDLLTNNGGPPKIHNINGPTSQAKDYGVEAHITVWIENPGVARKVRLKTRFKIAQLSGSSFIDRWIDLKSEVINIGANTRLEVPLVWKFPPLTVVPDQVAQVSLETVD